MKRMIALNNWPNVLLTGPRTIKRLSPINNNVEEQDIFTAVLSAQNIDLQQIIGSNLLWKLQELIATGDINSIERFNYKALLDIYITPFLTSVITFKLMPIIQYKIRNKGVVTTNDEHVNNAAYSEMKNVIELYRNESTEYGNILKKFLCKNRSSFPELECNQDTVVCPDLEKQYAIPFVL